VRRRRHDHVRDRGRVAGDPEHPRDRVTVDVGVHHADLLARGGQRRSQVDRDRGLAHAGVTGDQHQFRLATANDAVEGVGWLIRANFPSGFLGDGPLTTCVRLASAGDLQRTTAALDDAGERLSKLFLTQLGLNAGFGFIIGAGLWLIGVPSAPLWGLLAMILRFVPYIGAVISAIFPLVLAAAVGPGWTMVLWTAALFLIVEPIAGQVVEPLVYGHSAGLSPVAVIVSATFWTWLWGPIGLILATPLTICLVVLGRHVDRLEFLNIMFGDEPPLQPAQLIYQRMLARDPVEAAEQAQAFLREKPLSTFYDEVLLEGLHLAQRDAERGLLDDERTLRIRDAVAEIIDDLSGHQDSEQIIQQEDASKLSQSPLAQLQLAEAQPKLGTLREQWQTEKPVLCIPGGGPLDEAAALMIAQLLGRQGIGARVEHADALSMARILGWDTKGVALVCLCYVADASSAQIRYAIRRLRRKTPDIPILVALLGDADDIKDQDLLAKTEFVQHSLRSTVDQIVATASNPLEQAKRLKLRRTPWRTESCGLRRFPSL